MTTALVTLTNGRATTTSLKIAEIFEKRHDNVIQSIRNMGCSEEFTDLNYQVSEYNDSTGRSLTMYEITRDGFTLLAMGFTGEKAMKFKEAYINAFNEMEKRLCEHPQLDLEKMNRQFKAALNMAKALGLSKDVTIKAVDNAVRRSTGFAPSEIFSVPAEPVEPSPAVKKIMQAVNDGVRGFRGGYISTAAVSVLLGYKVYRWKEINEELRRLGYVRIEKRTQLLPVTETLPYLAWYRPYDKIRHSVFVTGTPCEDFHTAQISH